MSPREHDAPCRLRPYKPGDLPELLRLDRHCFPPAIAYDRLEMIHQLTAPSHICLLAVPPAGGAPPLLGFVIAAVGKANREGQIVTIDVDPGARRRGIGYQLLTAVEQELAGRRNRSVRLQVAEDNVGAQEFYCRMGYREAGRRPGYYPDGSDAIEMIKEFSGPGSRRSAG